MFLETLKHIFDTFGAQIFVPFIIFIVALFLKVQRPVRRDRSARIHPAVKRLYPSDFAGCPADGGKHRRETAGF